ncbi:hypothetical protein ES703_110351 [subsurface metagenome]
MERGTSKYWTPGKELEFEERIKRCRTFAERCLFMTTRDLLKYDGRSKEGKRAMVQAKLRLAVATDEDLKEFAELQTLREEDRRGEIPGLHRASLVAKNLGRLKYVQAKIKENGIKRSELGCQEKHGPGH